MKNLLLVLAFMLSMGAFAQKTITPRDPETLCYLAIDFEPECPIIKNGFIYFHSLYELNICGDLVDTMSPIALKQMIQDYICTYNTFPSYVEVLSSKPIKIRN